MSKYLTLGLGTAAMLFAVLSARLGVPYLAYGVVACAATAMVLCAWDKLDWKTAPYLVFLLGLAFLYQTTLISNGLVGTDIHAEYYMYQQALDGWDWAYPHNYNTAIGATVVAPFLTNWFGIPGYWIFKAIFPALFALVPLILFIVYRKEFGEKIAFLGCLFFITLPTYTLEMIGLPRQMLGELMLAIILLLVIVSPIRLRYSVPLLVAVATLGYLFHYIMGPAILMYTAGCALVLMFVKARRFPIRWLALVIVLPALVGGMYYASVAEGKVLSDLLIGSTWTVERTIDVLPGPSTPSEPESGEQAQPTLPEDAPTSYFRRQEPLMRTALGLDFMDASPLGKIFRIFQFATQLALILGCVWLLRNRRKISPEYIAFTLTALTLVAACVFLIRFSNMLNLTRFYHLALFLLSPLLVAGCLYFTRNLKVSVLALLIPYMLFTTGVVFEVAKETDVSRVNMPYSIPLSNHRVDLVGAFSDNDIAVRDWIADSELPVVADINGLLLLAEKANPSSHRHTSHTNLLTALLPDDWWGYIPRSVAELPEGTYIFLTEHNMRTRTVLFKPDWYAQKDTASGMRQPYPFEFVGISDNMDVVYRQGDATVLRVGGNSE